MRLLDADRRLVAALQAGRRSSSMQKKELLYEGKAKKVYRTTDPQVYIVS